MFNFKHSSLNLFLLLAFVFTLSACGGQSPMEKQKVNFEQVDWYAKRASAAYLTDQEIKETFPNVQRIVTLDNIDVKYFLETDEVLNTQTLSVRGTNNLQNAKEDAEYVVSQNRNLQIFVHSGFDEDATAVFNDVLPYLDKDKKILVTGHSLGAAASTLIMMYLYEAGFDVGPSINFGQPKVTNAKGAQKYSFLPLIRVVDENDVVPLLPPATLLSAVHGQYEHMGPEVIILEGIYYVFQDQHLQREFDTDSFWENIADVSVKAHYMAHYLKNINAKLLDAEQISYKQRKQFIDN